MQYGDLGRRTVAYIIDTIIINLIYWVTISMFFPVVPPAPGMMSSFVGIIPFLGMWFTALTTRILFCAFFSWLYLVLMEGSGWHATIGKRIMGLYIANESGEGISYSTSILRNIGKFISSILFIGYIMGFFSEEKQCLHDMIAKTYVLAGDGEDARADYAGYGNNHNGSPARVKRGKGPVLVGVKGPLAGMMYDVTEKGLLIGRDNVSCQVVLPDSQGKVSRNHCFVTYNPISSVFVLNDRKSTHGTYLMNGSKVSYSQPAALKSGDKFYIATTENIFEVR